MQTHEVRTRRSAEEFPRSEHLAWKIAEIAADPVEVTPEVEGMVINRIIDNAAVSAASVIRRPVTVARTQAQAHRTQRGATVFGIDGTYSPNGPPGPTGLPCANSTSTTPSWPPSTRTRVTTSRPWSRWPSSSTSAAVT